MVDKHVEASCLGLKEQKESHETSQSRQLASSLKKSPRMS